MTRASIPLAAAGAAATGGGSIAAAVAPGDYGALTIDTTSLSSFLARPRRDAGTGRFSPATTASVVRGHESKGCDGHAWTGPSRAVDTPGVPGPADSATRTHRCGAGEDNLCSRSVTRPAVPGPGWWGEV